MEVTKTQIAAGVAVVAGLFVALQRGEVQVEHPDVPDAAIVSVDGGPPGHAQAAQHARVGWPKDDAGVEQIPEGSACARFAAVGPSEAWALLGFSSNTPRYAVGYVRSVPEVADFEAQLPEGVRVLDLDLVECGDRTGRLEVWTDDHENAPTSRCACASADPADGVCERFRNVPETDAGFWETMSPGSAASEYRGTGCVPLATCVEAAELGLGSAIDPRCSP